MPAKINLSELNEKRILWPDLNTDVMDHEASEKFLRKKRAVDLYIDGLAPSKIAELTGVASSEIIRCVKRCASMDNKGIMLGYKALLPYKHASKKNSKLENLFFTYPTLEPFILGNYFGNKEYTLERNMNFRTLHAKFIEKCINLGIQDYEYPLCLKDKGYPTIVRYIKNKELEMQNTAIKRENKNAKQHFLSTGFGESTNINPLAPYNIVQIDGHKIDMLYSVEVENEHGEQIRMPATRIWLIAVIDVATRTIIGYTLSPYENYNQYDILQAIYNSISPHKKMEFKRNTFKYPEGGGFPSLYIPEIEWALFDMIMLDNAKSHLAKNVLKKLTDDLKCVVNFGSVATPETRGIIERFFYTLERSGIHKLPGTTGSNIYDNKRNNPEYSSVKYAISYDDICELIEYLIAEYNTSAHSSLENQTPLQVLSRRVKAGMQPSIVPITQRKNIEKLTYFTVERTLRGGYKKGTRPHLSYLGVQYHAFGSQIPMEYVGQKVFIEVNPFDVSHVKLYTDDGIYISDMIATGEWGRRPHSIKTHRAALERKNKNAMINTKFTPHLTEYEDELRANATKSRRSRTRLSIVKKEENQNVAKNSGLKKIEGDTKIKSNDTYSKDEMELLDSMSIEEAYQKGLI